MLISTCADSSVQALFLCQTEESGYKANELGANSKWKFFRTQKSIIYSIHMYDSDYSQVLHIFFQYLCTTVIED